MSSNAEGGAILLVIGGAFLYMALRNHKKARKIQDTQRSKSSSAPQGFVELEGFAWPRSETVTSPQGFKAVYHSFQIQRLESKGSGKNRRTEWVTVFSRDHKVSFYLIDGNGAVLVNPSSAEFELESDQTNGWSSLTEIEKQRVLGILGSSRIIGFPPASSFFGLFEEKYRVVENWINVGGPVYVHGNFASYKGSQDQIKSVGLTKFYNNVFDSNSKSLKNKDAVLDVNRNGKVSAQESKRGYATIAKLILNQNGDVSEEREFPVHGIIEKSNDHGLIIADVHERHLVNRMGVWIWPKILVGAAMFAGGVMLLLA